MKIKTYFKSILSSIINRRRDSLTLTIIFVLLIAMLFIFYGFDLSSSTITDRIDENVKIYVDIEASIPDDVEEDEYKKNMVSLLDISSELNSSYNESVAVISASIYLDLDEMIDTFNIYGYNDYLYQEDYEIIKGNAIKNDNEILIREDFIFNHHLYDVGDEIKVYNRNLESKTYKIVGIFIRTDDPSPFDKMTLYPYDVVDIIATNKSIIDFADRQDRLIISPIYNIISGLRMRDSIINSINSSMSSLGISYSLDIDDSLATTLKTPINNASKLYQIMSLVFMVLISCLLIYVLIYIIKNRTKEYGIWLSLGENKLKVASRFLAEILIIESIAFIICMPFSKLFFNRIYDTMINANQNIQAQILRLNNPEELVDIDTISYTIELNADDYLTIYGYLLVIATISTSIAFVPILSLKTVKILGQ